MRRVRELLGAGDEDRALEELIKAWRVARGTELADELGELALELSSRFEPNLPPLAGKLAEFHPAWMAVARRRRAVDLPRLVGSVLETTHRFGSAIVTALLERGAVLATWPADPRTPALLIEHLRRPGYEATSRSTLPFWSQLFELLTSCGDARAAAFLSKVRFARTFRSLSDGKRRIEWFQTRADEAAAALGARLEAPRLAIAKGEKAELRALKKALASLAPAGPNQAVRERLARSLAPSPQLTKPRPRRKGARAGSVAVFLAAAAKARGEAEQLSNLLGAWQLAPVPELATLIEDVSRRADSRLPAIRGATRVAIHKTWFDTLKKDDPRDVPRLLASITETKGRSTDALARLEGFASRPRDPRTAAAVLAQLEVPAFHSSSSQPFWQALITLAVEHGDRRAADAFDAIAARFEQILAAPYGDRKGPRIWFRRQLTAAASSLRALPEASLPAADRRRLETLASRLGDFDSEHLRRIALDPADETARHVYADHLLERGDPRGEFIALQLANRDPERAAELARDHCHTWVGQLTPFLDLAECRFEGGFLSHAAIASLEPDRLVNVSDDPTWSTVRTIHLGHVGARRFAVSSAMRSLEKVTAGTRRQLTLAT